MKKIIGFTMVCLVALAALTGCGSTEEQPESGNAGNPGDTQQEQEQEEVASTPITVISREDGSGTRGAFIELFGVEEENEAGEKVDQTIATADITNSTAVMLTSVAQNTAAIGYISLGSLDDSVRALEIDGAAATVENIENGSYTISRPFTIATQEGLSEVAQDFVNFILSSDGQAVVADNGYIPVEATGAYSGSQPSGKIVVAGSSSVSPVMEKLKEAYLAVNPNAEIELQTSDSTTGMNSTMEGICDIGMASRALKDSELEAGLTATVIATDGIAVIVNNENPVTGLTTQQVKEIYTGVITDWSQIQ